MKRIIGNIGALKMPNGQYVFGRIMKDAAVEFYSEFGETKTDLPKDYTVAFVVGVYNRVVRQMKLVGKRPFSAEEDTWPAPSYIKDRISGGFSTYHYGKITPSTYEACKGMEKAAVWDDVHLFDRLLDGSKRWGSTILE